MRGLRTILAAVPLVIGASGTAASGLATDRVEPVAEGGSTGHRACVAARPGELFQVDFRDAELGRVARLVACAAELGLVLEPASLASARVTVIASAPVPLEGLRRVFEHALTSHGLVMERRGAYHVIRRVEPPG